VAARIIELKHRKLRIAWSVACGVACLALITLWMRSYWWVELFYLPINASRAINIGYVPGFLAFGTGTSSKPLGSAKVLRIPANQWGRTRSLVYAGQASSQLTGGILNTPNVTTVLIPFWFATFCTGLLGFSPWFKIIQNFRAALLKLPRQFSLSTLLIATTLVAIGLGLIVWLR
jgi:hypothetical protein